MITHGGKKNVQYFTHCQIIDIEKMMIVYDVYFQCPLMIQNNIVRKIHVSILENKKTIKKK